LKAVPSFISETRGVEELYANDKSRVCLLDPAAAKDLSPEDGDVFDVFLFGGILGMLILGGVRDHCQDFHR
jgi:ribosome biogenesis SPOUT family RNA methylase Rps3